MLNRVTGTHVYTYLKCPRAVALDLHMDRSQRRPSTEAEEFSLRRGLDHEAKVVAALGYEAPKYPDHDHQAGAEATRSLMAQGVKGIHQGVLLGERRLGIPDLLRRESGQSELGDFHYVVGDVKSSGRARGDQILQVAFYSRLLEKAQGRAPAYSYLLLKDGREERFDLADYQEVLDEVEEKIGQLGQDPVAEPAAARPFLVIHCRTCHWSHHCSEELHERDDLSLLPQMTRGLRQVLESVGVTSTAAAASMDVEVVAKTTEVEAPLLRRLQRASHARREGRALPEPRGLIGITADAAAVHVLRDPFADRILWIGVLYPATPGGFLRQVTPQIQQQELQGFLSMVRTLPGNVALLHYGDTVPDWYEDVRGDLHATTSVERRFVDLARRLRSAAAFPGAVFGLEDLIRFGLGVDPERCGDAAAAAAWADAGRFDRIAAKGECDLRDLARLKVKLLDRTGDGAIA